MWVLIQGRYNCDQVQSKFLVDGVTNAIKSFLKACSLQVKTKGKAKIIFEICLLLFHFLFVLQFFFVSTTDIAWCPLRQYWKHNFSTKGSITH